MLEVALIIGGFLLLLALVNWIFAPHPPMTQRDRDELRKRDQAFHPPTAGMGDGMGGSGF